MTSSLKFYCFIAYKHLLPTRFLLGKALYHLLGVLMRIWPAGHAGTHSTSICKKCTILLRKKQEEPSENHLVLLFKKKSLIRKLPLHKGMCAQITGSNQVNITNSSGKALTESKKKTRCENEIKEESKNYFTRNNLSSFTF